MKISEIQFVPIEPREGLIGFASFILEDSIRVSGVGVHTYSSGGVRLVFPGNKFGTFVYPTKKEITDEITNAVYEKYQKILNEHLSEVSYHEKN